MCRVRSSTTSASHRSPPTPRVHCPRPALRSVSTVGRPSTSSWRGGVPGDRPERGRPGGAGDGDLVAVHLHLDLPSADGDQVLHEARSSTATVSTCAVWGNRSNASAELSRKLRSRVEVPGQGGGVAGDVDDPAGRRRVERGRHPLVHPGARRVGDDQIRRAESARPPAPPAPRAAPPPGPEPRPPPPRAGPTRRSPPRRRLRRGAAVVSPMPA